MNDLNIQIGTFNGFTTDACVHIITRAYLARHSPRYIGTLYTLHLVPTESCDSEKRTLLSSVDLFPEHTQKKATLGERIKVD